VNNVPQWKLVYYEKFYSGSGAAFGSQVYRIQVYNNQFIKNVATHGTIAFIDAGIDGGFVFNNAFMKNEAFLGGAAIFTSGFVKKFAIFSNSFGANICRSLNCRLVNDLINAESVRPKSLIFPIVRLNDQFYVTFGIIEIIIVIFILISAPILLLIILLRRGVCCSAKHKNRKAEQFLSTFTDFFFAWTRYVYVFASCFYTNAYIYTNFVSLIFI